MLTGSVKKLKAEYIAELVASCPLACRKVSNDVFRIDNYEIRVRIIDLVSEIENYVDNVLKMKS